MTRGALLVGCGFLPNERDAQFAIRQGCLKHYQVITAAGFRNWVGMESALNTYLTVAQLKGWADPGGLEVINMMIGSGRWIWCVYPVGQFDKCC